MSYLPAPILLFLGPPPVVLAAPPCRVPPIASLLLWGLPSCTPVNGHYYVAQPPSSLTRWL